MDLHLAKPKFSTPCNRCGYCCAMERCWISIQAFGEGPGPCPGLEWDGPQAACGVLRAVPPLLQPKVAYALALGRGCDAADDDESDEWNKRAPSAGDKP